MYVNPSLPVYSVPPFHFGIHTYCSLLSVSVFLFASKILQWLCYHDWFFQCWHPFVFRYSSWHFAKAILSVTTYKLMRPNHRWTQAFLRKKELHTCSASCIVCIYPVARWALQLQHDQNLSPPIWHTHMYALCFLFSSAFCHRTSETTEPSLTPLLHPLISLLKLLSASLSPPFSLLVHTFGSQLLHPCFQICYCFQNDLLKMKFDYVFLLL